MQNLYSQGYIEVVCGPMFAGKTEELIRRIKRYEYANKEVVVFKPIIDNRYSALGEIVSHNLSKKPSILINKAEEIFSYINDTTNVVVIDEAQFFDNDIIDVCEELADRGLHVICGGLDRDFKGEPFGPIPFLLAKAEQVTKLTAICVKSGLPATRTQRMVDGKPANYNDPLIVIGAKEQYEPRARHCHEVPGKQRKYKN